MSLLIATPVRAAELSTAQVSLGYAEFRERLVRHMPDYKALSGTVTFSLDVVRARNRIVGFLLTREEFRDVSHVLWVDDDQWPEDIRIVTQMIENCRGVLAAPYTNKKLPLRYVHQTWDDKLYVGFGFTMTTRTCLETVANDAYWYTDLPSGQRCPNLFGQCYKEVAGVVTLLSEDYSFCERAHEMGFKVELYEHGGKIFHAGGHAWTV
jgi:hypothetical protein